MVDSKIKKATVSAAKKNITASGVRIENGTFVDDEGSIVERIAEKLPEGTTCLLYTSPSPRDTR